MARDIITGAIITLLVVVAIGAFLSWTNVRDALREAAAQDYEDCMSEKTGMLPYEFRAKFGYYPECY